MLGISTHEKTLIKFWLILVMQLTKSKFVLTARGVQFDNGVISPCGHGLVRLPYCTKFMLISYMYWMESFEVVYGSVKVLTYVT